MACGKKLPHAIQLHTLAAWLCYYILGSTTKLSMPFQILGLYLYWQAQVTVTEINVKKVQKQDFPYANSNNLVLVKQFVGDYSSISYCIHRIFGKSRNCSNQIYFAYIHCKNHLVKMTTSAWLPQFQGSLNRWAA